jgi:hypothetical protein
VSGGHGQVPAGLVRVSVARGRVTSTPDVGDGLGHSVSLCRNAVVSPYPGSALSTGGVRPHSINSSIISRAICLAVTGEEVPKCVGALGKDMSFEWVSLRSSPRQAHSRVMARRSWPSARIESRCGVTRLAGAARRTTRWHR